MSHKSYKVLIICTSNKDRSPVLQEYLSGTYPQHQYRSAGVNKYYCQKKGTHYLEHEDIRWCDLILFCEDVHMAIFYRDFANTIANTYIDKNIPNAHTTKEYGNNSNIGWRVLNCGKYEQGCVGDDYIMKADLIFKEAIS